MCVPKLLDRYGETDADEAGITLRDKPAPLYRRMRVRANGDLVALCRALTGFRRIGDTGVPSASEVRS